MCTWYFHVLNHYPRYPDFAIDCSVASGFTYTLHCRSLFCCTDPTGKISIIKVSYTTTMLFNHYPHADMITEHAIRELVKVTN